MSYTKTVWRNNQAPAINADNLNHIEQGIESAHNQIAIDTSNIETLTTQVQGNASNIASEISARQSGDSNLQSQIDQIIAPSGEAPSAAEVENARVGASVLGNQTYDTLGNAIRGQVTDLQNEIDDIVETYNILTPYFYKKDTYIRADTETTLSGYDLYKIPLNDYDIIHVKWDSVFYGALSFGYVFSIEDDNGDVANVNTATMRGFVNGYGGDINELIMINNGDYKNLYISTYSGDEDNAILAINHPYIKIRNPHIHGVTTLNNLNTIRSTYYLTSGSVLSHWDDTYYSYVVPVKAGDKIGFTDNIASGLSNRGRVRYNDGTELNIVDTNLAYFSKDGIAFLYLNLTSQSPILYPIDSVKIESDNIVLPQSYADVKQLQIDNMVTSFNNILAPYLYKRNVYIDNSGNEVSYMGLNLYKIPLEASDILQFKWDNNQQFWGGLAFGFVFTVVQNDDSYLHPTGGAGNTDWYLPSNTAHEEAIFINKTNSFKAIIITVAQQKENLVIMNKNNLYPDFNMLDAQGVLSLNTDNTIRSIHYFQNTGKMNTFAGTPNYYTYFKKVKMGDKIELSGTMSGVSYAGNFQDQNGTLIKLENTDADFTAPSDGIISVFVNPTMSRTWTYFPVNSIKIEGKNIVNFTGGDTQFQGLNGVAFGTSLTYRAQTTYGYLNKLAELSGITFDNQGIGSSKILGNMLTAIKNYNGYADKNICLLEGFVNDWYQSSTLGTWKDTTENTACGCVRSALNYMLSQNANMTIFLILDHYGRNTSNTDCSTTAINSAGLTQYEYYSEIAKVAESLGIPVIREFEDSGISQNTPQYLADNIHLNSLGADQSGNVIWYQMKQYPVNL